jgi:hypothetical protein
VETVAGTDFNALLDPVSAEIEYDAAGNPTSAVLVMKDGLKVNIRILSYIKSKIKPEDAFRPQADFGSDWIVTEL